MSDTGPSILFLAGDVSGDVHAAALGRTLLEQDPSVTVHALGGRRLREVVAQSGNGCFLADTTNRSAIGLLSSLQIYFKCRKLRDRLWEFVDAHHIDLAILCDWGAFNSRVLPGFHARGIRTLYYFPPRSWQRSGPQGLGIVPYATRVATPFEWSAERLRKAGANAEWVGHASIDTVPAADERPALRRQFGVSPNEKLIALLPGSRLTEIRAMAKRMAGAAAIVREKLPSKFIAVTPPELANEARKYLPDSIRIVTECAKELLRASDAAIVKTGTGTLEAVLAGAPQVTMYDVSPIGRLEWLILWAWRWVPFIAMPNIILQREVVPELIGIECQPRRIANALMPLLMDDTVRARIRRDYKLIHRALGSELPRSPTERTAEIVQEMLSETTRRAELERAAA
jgi:lipid-A-disaccharide synthase